MSFDNRVSLVNDKIEDALFSYAGTCHINNIVQETSQFKENTNINPHQDELDRKIQDYIRNCRRKNKWLKGLDILKKTSKFAAIVIISVAVLFTVLVSSVDAFRVIFLNIFIEDKEEYSKITIEKNDPNYEIINNLINNKELNNCYIPAYIPKNFSVVEIIQGNSTIITFMDTTSNLLIFEQSKDMSKEYMIDTEDANKENILIQGQNAVIIIKGKITTVLWQNNERVFNVCGQIDREEILKFCESLYFKK